MLCNGSLLSEDGFARPSLATITDATSLGISFVPAHDYRRWWWHDWTYQLIVSQVWSSRLESSSTSLTLKMRRRTMVHRCGAWGSALHWLLNGGVAHTVATCLISIGWGVLFPVKTFSGFPHFSRKKPFDLYLSSFFFLLLLHLLSTIGFSDFLSCAFCS